MNTTASLYRDTLSQPLRWRPDPGSTALNRSWTLERPRLQPPSSTFSPAQQRMLLAAPWLSEVSVPTRQALIDALQVRVLRAGERVLEQGAPATRWHGVASGAVRLSSLSAAGRQLAVGMLAPGEWFGEVCAPADSPALCNAHAQVDSAVVSLPLETLRALMHRHEDLRHALLRWSSARMHAWMEAALEASSAPLYQRLAARLLDLGRRFGQPQGDGFQLMLQVTQTDLAQLVATSRQRLNQGLQDLRRDGLLDMQEGPLTVLSTAALQRRAGLA